MSESKTKISKNIHEAQLEVMREVPYLQKRKSDGLNYTFASESDLIHKVRDSMLDNGISIFPIRIEFLSKDDVKSKTGTCGTILRFLFTYRFMHALSGTFQDIQTVGEAQDWGDKAANKAMTISQKYALRMFLLIETGDDPDLVAHNRDAENSDWVRAAVQKIEKCRDDKALDQQMERFRGMSPETGEPLFTDSQLSELASYAEKHRSKLRQKQAGTVA